MDPRLTHASMSHTEYSFSIFMNLCCSMNHQFIYYHIWSQHTKVVQLFPNQGTESSRQVILVSLRYMHYQCFYDHVQCQHINVVYNFRGSLQISYSHWKQNLENTIYTETIYLCHYFCCDFTADLRDKTKFSPWILEWSDGSMSRLISVIRGRHRSKIWNYFWFSI